MRRTQPTSAGSETLSAVSVLGTGAIGSRVATVLLAKGVRVTVWNRTADRADEVVRYGAVRTESAAEAAAASPLVILCFTDYKAVNETLASISGASRGRTLVALTTGSPEEARAAARAASTAGAAYLDGGVQSSPDAIGTDAATFLYSGPQDTFEQHEAELATIGTARYLGSDPGAAAVQDLALFGLWYDAQIGYLRALDTVRAAGIDVEDFAPVAAAQLQHVVQGAEETAREVVDRTFPRGPADLTEHAAVLDKLTELRHGQRLGDGELDKIRSLMRQRIEQGRGGEGLNALLD